jgi:hypothetical protein
MQNFGVAMVRDRRQEDRCAGGGGRPLLIGLEEGRGRADLEACVMRSLIVNKLYRTAGCCIIQGVRPSM